MTVGIAKLPRPGFVYWTAYSAPEGSSQPADPLRFDMYAQRLGNLLLPGITNRTERLRYLSMVCAGIATTSGAGQGTLREQRQAFLPFERGWALAMTVSVDGELKGRDGGEGPKRSLKPEFRGLRGANRVLTHYRTLRDGKSINPTRYVLLKAQDAQGGLGAYLVTLRQFKFVQDDSLDLTALGHELVNAFKPKRRGRRLTTLAESDPVPRSALSRLGEDLSLGAPGAEEKAIVREAVFSDERQPVADCIRRMRTARPDSDDPRVLLEAIARSDGDPLERAARFSVAFDPMRIALLQTFSRLGGALSVQPGSVDLESILTPEMEEAAESAREGAGRLANCPAVPGLAPVSDLAQEIAGGSSVLDTVRSTVAFHRREGRAWIVADGPNRYSVGHHGPFDEPLDEFNGYTVGRAMQLFADTEAVS